MKIKSLTIACCCLSLMGCAHNSFTPTQEDSQYDAYMALGEAAAAVNHSWTTLGQTEQAAKPPVKVSEAPNPASYGMALPATIDWNGPVEPLVKQIAATTNYQLHVLGNAPAVPVIVSINAKNTPIGNILRDAGYQSGQRANIVVFPSTRVIELRYANS